MSRAHIFFDTPNTYLSSNIEEVAIILGTSNDGPANNPCLIKSYVEFIRIFGEDSTMENAYLAMLNRSNIEVYVMRLNGTNASVQIPYGDKYFTLTSYKAGSQYNNRLSVLVDERDKGDTTLHKCLTLLDSDYTNRAGNHEIITYDLTKYNNVSKLCEVINRDQRYNVHGFTALDTEMASGLALTLDLGTYPLLGGLDYEYLASQTESETLFGNYITSITESEGYGFDITFNGNLLQSSVNDVGLVSYLTKDPEQVETTATGAIPDEFHNIIGISLSAAPLIGDVLCIADGVRSADGTYLPSYRFEWYDGAWQECRSLKQLLRNSYSDHLYNSSAKTIVLTGVHYGNSVDYSFDLAEFCYQMNKVGYPLIGVLSTYPKGDQLLADYLAQLGIFRAQDDFTVDNQDAGAYLCLAAGEVNFTYNNVSRHVTLEGFLGGLLTSIPNYINATNKILHEDVTLVYDFKEFSIRNLGYLEALTDLHFNVPYLSVGRGICLYNAVTAAENGFKWTKNARIGQEIVSRISLAVEPYIGQTIDAISSDSLNNTVAGILDEMIIEKYLKTYDYTLQRDDFYDVTINVGFMPVGDINTLSVCIVV